jgi:carbon-monoxide dehydrogenase medium subunit
MMPERHDMTNTHLVVQGFDYLEPASLDEAIGLLEASGDGARLLAGGTNLLVDMKVERTTPRALINITRLSQLRGIREFDGGLQIGALTTIRELAMDHYIGVEYQALQEAAAAFGSTQIQVMGTIGGNLCNGSPASDTVPALLAFDAQVVLRSSEGERVMPIKDFLVGPGKTALRRGEILTGVRLPGTKTSTGSAFLKLSRVTADLAKINVVALVVREGDHIMDCRLAFGSVGPTVLRAEEAERVLIGKKFSPKLVLEAGRIASNEISPIDDARSTAWYRSKVAIALTHDALRIAWDRAKNQRAAKTVKTTSPPEARPTSVRMTANETRAIELIVNGTRHRLEVAPNELLLNVLRERMGLTGAKYGCGIGECGACTVLLNGAPVLACLVLVVTADGSEILTVEGLAKPDGTLDPIQQAFIDQNAFQCGYCSPGMLMMTKKLLEENPTPSEEELRDYLKGNQCRCTGYASIARAVEQSANRSVYAGGKNE